MLLLPLLENAYKYGFSGDNASGKIQIEFIQNASDFKFKIENTNGNTHNKIDDNYSGVGLENLRNNLNLVYPDTHNLNIEHTDVTFVVTLNLKNAEHFKKPFLLIYGSHDKIVHSQGSREFFALNQKSELSSNLSKEICYEGFFPHELYNSSKREEVMQNLVDWLTVLVKSD